MNNEPVYNGWPGFTWEERAHKAMSPTTKVELLRELSKDPDFYVRSRLATNPNTPTDIIEKLSTDSHFYVRAEAKTRLGRTVFGAPKSSWEFIEWAEKSDPELLDEFSSMEIYKKDKLEVRPPKAIVASLIFFITSYLGLALSLIIPTIACFIIVPLSTYILYKLTIKHFYGKA